MNRVFHLCRRDAPKFRCCLQQVCSFPQHSPSFCWQARHLGRPEISTLLVGVVHRAPPLTQCFRSRMSKALLLFRRTTWLWKSSCADCRPQWRFPKSQAPRCSSDPGLSQLVRTTSASVWFSKCLSVASSRRIVEEHLDCWVSSCTLPNLESCTNALGH
jgi:hypothetical protein